VVGNLFGERLSFPGPLRHDFVSDNIPLRKMPPDNTLAYRFHTGMSSYESPLLSPLEEMKQAATLSRESSRNFYP